ncbi:MAG: hypothetical protein HUK20_07290 [Fibrobacter sp.]|nr:hypothetical protein [Fibrobacter sp.]
MNGKDGVDGKDGVNGKDGADGKDCKGKNLEDGSIEISCGDEVIDTLKNGLSVSALPYCGMLQYDPQENYCSERYQIKELASCGREKYIPETHYCNAENRIVMFSTCGSASYNPETHYCVSGKLMEYPKCGSSYYNPETHYCSSESKVSVYSSCGVKSYNPETHFCTDENEIAEIAKCGTESYDESTQYCTSANKVAPLQSCGSSLYNPETEYCNLKDSIAYPCSNLPAPPAQSIKPDEDGFYNLSDVYRSLKCSDRVAFVIRHSNRNSNSSSSGYLNETGKRNARTLGTKLVSKENFSYFNSGVQRTTQTGWFIGLGREEIVASDTLSSSAWRKENSITYSWLGGSAFTDLSGWQSVSEWSYKNTTELNKKADEFLKNIKTEMERSNRVSVMVTHDFTICPFIIWASNGEINLHWKDDDRYTSTRRWPNYMSGVAVILHEDNTTEYIVVKGIENENGWVNTWPRDE